MQFVEKGTKLLGGARSLEAGNGKTEDDSDRRSKLRVITCFKDWIKRRYKCAEFAWDFFYEVNIDFD